MHLLPLSCQSYNPVNHDSDNWHEAIDRIFYLKYEVVIEIQRRTGCIFLLLPYN